MKKIYLTLTLLFIITNLFSQLNYNTKFTYDTITNVNGSRVVNICIEKNLKFVKKRTKVLSDKNSFLNIKTLIDSTDRVYVCETNVYNFIKLNETNVKTVCIGKKFLDLEQIEFTDSINFKIVKYDLTVWFDDDYEGDELTYYKKYGTFPNVYLIDRINTVKQ